MQYSRRNPIVTASIALLLSGAAAAQSPYLKVDSFGYRPTERKLCVIRTPEVGFDQAESFNVGATLRVRRSSDDVIVFQGAPQAWGGGTVHAQSGDRAHRLDFSGLTQPGTYYVEDPSGERSEDFTIQTDPFVEARRAAVRAFFYQRCGVSKAQPFADARWTDTPCHRGPGQDEDCRPATNPAGTSRSLWGGWHDAGDYNKYINFADGVLHELLGAYEVAPHAWDDASGIPESGNGIPDILDECRFELQWFLRMQLADGSVLHKVSVNQYQAASPPSADGASRFYAPATASATASACGVFARAALVFRDQPNANAQAFAALFEDAARLAWTWLQTNPNASNFGNAGFLNAAAEDSPQEQAVNRMVAAAWLAQLTGESPFHAYVAANYDNLPGLSFVANPGGWVSPYEFTGIDALLSYADDPLAPAAVRQKVHQSFRASMTSYWTNPINADSDAYAAWLNGSDHVWGSNRTRSTVGTLYARMADLDLEPCNSPLYSQAASHHAHWLHGVNPMGLTYLTNMGDFGAANSVHEPYHAWFDNGTIFDGIGGSNVGPAPGLLVGGPNQFFEPDDSYNGPPLEPPMGQPVQKCFLDWNTGFPENSWQITEPSIVYQGAYVRLMAELTPAPDGPVQYCPSSPNTSGERAHLQFSGSTSISAGDLSMEVSCGPAQTFGIVVYGFGAASIPIGVDTPLCVANVQRVPNAVLFSNTGTASIPLDLGSSPFDAGEGQVAAGETWMFQVWFREPTGPQPRFEFTDALALLIEP